MAESWYEEKRHESDRQTERDSTLAGAGEFCDRTDSCGDLLVAAWWRGVSRLIWNLAGKGESAGEGNSKMSSESGQYQEDQEQRPGQEAAGARYYPPQSTLIPFQHTMGH